MPSSGKYAKLTKDTRKYAKMTINSCFSAYMLLDVVGLLLPINVGFSYIFVFPFLIIQAGS